MAEASPKIFKVKVTDNAKSMNQILTFPYDSNLTKKCPKWAKHFNSQIEINDISDLNAICSFFNTMINQNNQIPKEHFGVFSQLSLLSGHCEKFLPNFLQTGKTSDLLTFYIQTYKSRDSSDIEHLLSLRYDELLNDSSFFEMSINSHQRILTGAISNVNTPFPYSKFIRLIADNCETHPEIPLLLFNFSISKFELKDIDYLKSKLESAVSYFNNDDLYELYKFKLSNQQLDSERSKFQDLKQQFESEILQFDIEKRDFQDLKKQFEVERQQFEIEKRNFKDLKQQFETQKQQFIAEKQSLEFEKQYLEGQKRQFQIQNDQMTVLNQQNKDFLQTIERKLTDDQNSLQSKINEIRTSVSSTFQNSLQTTLNSHKADLQSQISQLNTELRKITSSTNNLPAQLTQTQSKLQNIQDKLAQSANKPSEVISIDGPCTYNITGPNYHYNVSIGAILADLREVMGFVLHVPEFVMQDINWN